MWITHLDALPPVRVDASGHTLRLSLHDVIVDAVADAGFWIVAPDSGCRLFVVPAEGELIHVHRGELVSVQGEVRTARTLSSSHEAGMQRYLYSYTVRPAW